MTIPPNPVPGQRYMRQIMNGSPLWEVFDWHTPSIGNNRNPVPILLGSMVSEEVARLIVFGPTLVAALQQLDKVDLYVGDFWTGWLAEADKIWEDRIHKENPEDVLLWATRCRELIRAVIVAREVITGPLVNFPEARP